MNNFCRLVRCVMMFFCFQGTSQEILDVSDLATYILGGDQKSVSANLELLPISLLNITTDILGVASFNKDTDVRVAGYPAFGTIANGGEATLESFWLNYTVRSLDLLDKFKIVVSTNQPLPEGMTLEAQIINVSGLNNFNSTPIMHPILLSEVEQVIVDDIPNGNTEVGVGKGFQVKYTLNATNAGELPSGFQVIYQLAIK
ncbi:hypothetical protein HCG49_10565 [Arenibacter sp. 6A1]|uniref:hypothetical protein n=1 Tax=Arenibacter sp. 6A1 TaxID=2720391 RepID=UPI0014450BA1|nr:hypothetical protein [Arenibacter sp. 6A1]NKI27004.1 hypothetical protein [Arenibacter sp. 6A1]